MTDNATNDAFPHISPITQRFLAEARDVIAVILEDFDTRVDEILGGLDDNHQPWINALLEANKPEPRVVMPKFYLLHRL